MTVHYLRTGALITVALATTILAGCGGAESNAPTPAPGRANAGNDGTSFEPCSAVSDEQLRAFGVDPSTWSDISMSDDGLRGCRATSLETTLTLTVLDASPKTLYPTSVARWAGNDIGSPIDRYRFTNANACAAVIHSEHSVVALSLSDDRGEPVSDDISDLLCVKAAQILGRIGGIPAPGTGASFDVTADDTEALSYFRLMQVGRLGTDAVGDATSKAIDIDGRLVPYSTLDTLDEKDRASSVDALTEIDGRLQAT